MENFIMRFAESIKYDRTSKHCKDLRGTSGLQVLAPSKLYFKL